MGEGGAWPRIAASADGQVRESGVVARVAWGEGKIENAWVISVEWEIPVHDLQPQRRQAGCGKDGLRLRKGPKRRSPTGATEGEENQGFVPCGPRKENVSGESDQL